MTFAYRPSAVIEIAGRSLTAAQAGLQQLGITLGLNRHGAAELALWPGSKFSGAAAGDVVTLALGPAGDEVPVFSGQITARRQQTDRIVLEALDSSGPLSRTRGTITFEDSSISDIVTRIGQEAGMQVQADGGDQLSVYYVAPQRPLWDHLRDLARLTGSDLSVDAQGALLFQPGGTGSLHSLRHGAELIGWRLVAGEGPVAVTHAAHGSASETGTWHWVATDPLGAEPGLARVVGAFADRALAEAATTAGKTARDRAATFGHLMITGNAGIRPADTALVEGLPGGDPDPLRVRGVRHQLDGAAGFVTCLEIEGGGAGGGLLGGLG